MRDERVIGSISLTLLLVRLGKSAAMANRSAAFLAKPGKAGFSSQTLVIVRVLQRKKNGKVDTICGSPLSRSLGLRYEEDNKGWRGRRLHLQHPRTTISS